MTENFASAAELMAQVLGAPAFPFLTIEHPISSASTEMLTERAHATADACVALLCDSAAGSS